MTRSGDDGGGELFGHDGYVRRCSRRDPRRSAGGSAIENTPSSASARQMTARQS